MASSTSWAGIPSQSESLCCSNNNADALYRASHYFSRHALSPVPTWLKAPEPNLTSRTRLSGFSASFLHIIDAVCKGIARTVAVTSRMAYIRRSAGAKSADGATMATPTLRSWSLNASMPSSTVKPLIDSSLSRVPPVWPSPRPLIIGTTTPNDATNGASCESSPTRNGRAVRHSLE